MTNTSELWVQMGNVSSVKDGRRFLQIYQLYIYVPLCRQLFVQFFLPHMFILHKSVYKTLKEYANDFSDLQLLSSPDKDDALACSRKFVENFMIRRTTLNRLFMT